MIASEIFKYFIWILMVGGFASIVGIVWPWLDFSLQSANIGRWSGKQPWMIVRIFPPAENVRSIGEMHSFFRAMTASYLPRDPVDRYIWGSWHDKYSWEIHCIDGDPGLYCYLSEKRVPLLKKNLQTRFPGARIERVDDPMKKRPGRWRFQGYDNWDESGDKYNQFFGGYMDKMGSEDILGGKKGSMEGNDIFQYRSYHDFQHDENNPIGDPIYQLFTAMEDTKDCHIVIQYLSVPFGTNDAESKIKEKWEDQYKKIKQHMIEESVVPAITGADAEDESGGRAMLITQGEREVLEHIEHGIDDQVYKVAVRMGIWSKDHPKPKILFQEIFTYMEEFSTHMVRFLPHASMRTWNDDKGRDHGIFGPWIGIVKNQLYWERQVQAQAKIFYKSMLGRSDTGDKSGKWFTAETMASLFHFPNTTSQDPRDIQMAEKLSQGGDGEDVVVSTSAPTNLPS